MGLVMKGWIKRILTPQSAVQFPSLAPDAPFYAIGDVHGRLDLVEALMARLDPTLPVVFVGDYVDRGENSAGVLRFLQALSGETDRGTICLMGNHEDMLLSFLEHPERRGRTWLRNGGLQTLASFGVAGVSETSSGDALNTAAQDLRAAMGGVLIDWLRQRPLFWRSGNIVAVHAGADPEKPVEDQPVQNLIWGHPAFRTTLRNDGLWVLHGHTIVEEPLLGNGSISIDTGAYATGHLTAALVGNGTVEFVSS